MPKIIWTQENQIGPVQNDWYLTKIIWTVQKIFGPIKGQGITGQKDIIIIYFGQKYSKMSTVRCFVGIFGEA